MEHKYISGTVIELGRNVGEESNFVRIKRHSAPEVTIDGLTDQECRAFAPFFMDDVHVQLPLVTGDTP